MQIQYQRYFDSYFREYIVSLSKLQYEIGGKADLIGGVETKKDIRSKGGVFSLFGGSNSKDRSSVLFEIASPSIIPHIAQQNQEKFPYEFIFRSINHLLMDTVSSEFLFDTDFFPDMDQIEIFGAIFDKITAHYAENLENFLSNSYDPLGVLLMLGISQQNILAMKRRRIPCLNAYLEKLKSLLWGRFQYLMDLNIDSVRACITRLTLTHGEVRPHYVTRRYAEFVASIKSLNTIEGENSVAAYLLVLRTQMLELLNKLSISLSDVREWTVFRINNYDHVLAVLEERGINSEEIQIFRNLHRNETSKFVEDELVLYYKEFITFFAKSFKWNH